MNDELTPDEKDNTLEPKNHFLNYRVVCLTFDLLTPKSK
jgi:hypothetical protein